MDSRWIFQTVNYNCYSETATFNFLEEEAKKDILRTPVLNCQMTDALSALPPDTPDRDVYAKKFKRSVMNWVSSKQFYPKNKPSFRLYSHLLLTFCTFYFFQWTGYVRNIKFPHVLSFLFTMKSVLLYFCSKISSRCGINARKKMLLA